VRTVTFRRVFGRDAANKDRRELPAGSAAETVGADVAAPVAATAPRGRNRPRHAFVHDSGSRLWLDRLTDEDSREEAVVALHALLVSAAESALARKRGFLPHLGREARHDLVVEAAGDALVAVLDHLDDYRGESRFTTWAWKVAFFQTSVTLRRRAWMGRETPVEDAGRALMSREASPQRRLEQRELLADVKRAVEHELTPHQRAVFVALALNGVPVDVLAERMSTTRGALYKTLHDARHKLRAHLAG
jgi:RNA polymerase sigma-70 factor, ECF subfamily